MKTTIKIPYKDFINYTTTAIKLTNLKIKSESIKFMKNRVKNRDYEGDGECYEIPDYVEFEIELKK